MILLEQLFPGSSAVTVSAGDISGSANIFVSSTSVTSAPPPEITHGEYPYYLEISPELAHIGIGSQQQFTARAVDVLGNEREPAGDLSWSVLGDAGEIDSSGIFRAGDQPGFCRIVVTDGQVFGTAVINVSDDGFQELIILPSEVSLPSGAVQKFTILARTPGGELIPTLAAWRVIGNMGTVDASWPIHRSYSR